MLHANHASELGAVETVLIVKPSSLGDVVHTLPAVHALKAARPHLKISWLVNTEWMPLLAGNPDLERIVEFPRGRFRGLGGVARLPGWLLKLRRLKPDLALDFQGLARSALLARIAGAKRVYGLSDAREGAGVLYSHTTSVIASEHSVERYLRLVADLGITIERPLVFPLPAGEKPPAFDLASPYVLLHPFSRGAGKSLPRDAVGALCESLAPQRVVLVGRASEPFVASGKNCTDLLNRTSIAELIWLIRHARFAVSVDSGPMHIAAALTDDLLGIHTWSDPRLVGPYNANAWVWKAARIAKVGELKREVNEATPFAVDHVSALAAFVRDRLNDTSRR